MHNTRSSDPAIRPTIYSVGSHPSMPPNHNLSNNRMSNGMSNGMNNHINNCANNCSNNGMNNRSNNRTNINGTVKGPVQGPVHDSIHGPTYRLAHGRTYDNANSTSANRAYGFTDGPLNAHASVYAYNDTYSDARNPQPNMIGRTQTNQVEASQVETKNDGKNDNFYNQFQSSIRNSHKIKDMTGAYSLELDDRDELWDAI